MVICLTPEPTSALGMVSRHAVSYPIPKNSFLQKWIYELLFLSSQLYASAKRPPLNASSEARILPTLKHKSRPPHVTYSSLLHVSGTDFCLLSYIFYITPSPLALPCNALPLPPRGLSYPLYILNSPFLACHCIHSAPQFILLILKF